METTTIIGAGMAGLTAGRELASRGVQVVVLDKARGVGGRMATRRIDDGGGSSGGGSSGGGSSGVFDSGAQFFTARSAEFVEAVARWREQDAAREWCRGFPDGQTARGTNFQSDFQSDGHARFCGLAGMTSVPKLLAQSLDVRLNQTVARLEHRAGQWHVATHEGLNLSSDALILTPPLPQSLALLDSSDYQLPAGERAALEAVDYESCLCVMALLDGPSHIPAPGAIQLSSEPVWWIADNHQKGISTRAGAVTIHAAPGFSRDHYDAPHQEIAAALFENVREWLGAGVRCFQVRPWRYSKPIHNHAEPCLVRSDVRLALAGDGFAGAKVEGAFLSGLAAAHGLLKHAAQDRETVTLNA